MIKGVGHAYETSEEKFLHTAKSTQLPLQMTHGGGFMLNYLALAHTELCFKMK